MISYNFYNPTKPILGENADLAKISENATRRGAFGRLERLTGEDDWISNAQYRKPARDDKRRTCSISKTG